MANFTRKKWQNELFGFFLFFLVLAGCEGSGSSSTYIISDVSEEKAVASAPSEDSSDNLVHSSSGL